MNPGQIESDSSWSIADLKRPGAVVVVLLVLLISIVTAQLIACNVHELGHVAVALPLGWEVETINWCTPGGGGIEYSRIGTWAGNAQGYAGGLAGAVVLAAIYIGLIERRSLPERSSAWWVAGFGTVVWIGPQIVIALIEGSAGPGEDYTRFSRQLISPGF